MGWAELVGEDLVYVLSGHRCWLPCDDELLETSGEQGARYVSGVVAVPHGAGAVEHLKSPAGPNPTVSS